MSSKRDWVIIHDATHGDLAYAGECLRCGAVQKVALPISVDVYCAMMKAFGRAHGRCKQRTAELKARTPCPKP